MPERKRSIQLINDGTVCQNAHAFRDPGVITNEQAARMGNENCPYMQPCSRGELDKRRVLCAASIGGQVARQVARGSTIEAEMREVAASPLFPPHTKGTIDPYQDPDRVVSDKTKSLEMIERWANVVLYGEGDQGEQPAEETHTKQPVDLAFQRLVEADRFETVWPNGVPQQVPRDRCRCPILKVGDFCPIHGG